MKVKKGLYFYCVFVFVTILFGFVINGREQYVIFPLISLKFHHIHKYLSNCVKNKYQYQ